MRKRTAALVLSGAMVAGAAGTALVITPASAATSSNPVTSRLAAIKSALGGLVSDGTLTQAQADKVASTLDQKLPKHGPGDLDGDHGGRMFGRGMGMGLGQVQDAAAKALHLTTDQLRTQLRSGQTLAQIAATQKVSVDSLVGALVDAAKADLAAAVKAGRITQAQSDTVAGTLKQRITDLVDGKGLGRGLAGPGGMGPGEMGKGGFGHGEPGRAGSGSAPTNGAAGSGATPAA